MCRASLPLLGLSDAHSAVTDLLCDTEDHGDRAGGLCRKTAGPKAESTAHFILPTDVESHERSAPCAWRAHKAPLSLLTLTNQSFTRERGQKQSLSNDGVQDIVIASVAWRSYRLLR